MRAPTAKEMYRSQLSQLASYGPLPNWNSSDNEDESHTNTDGDGPGVDAHGNPLDDVVEGVSDALNPVESAVVSDVLNPVESTVVSDVLNPVESTVVSDVLNPVESIVVSHVLDPVESIVVSDVLSPAESFVSSVVHTIVPAPPTLTSLSSVSLPFVPVPSDPLSISLSLPITLPTSWPTSPLVSLPLSIPTLGYVPPPSPTQEPITSHTEESITSISNTETTALSRTTSQLSQFAPTTMSGSSFSSDFPSSAIPSYASFLLHHALEDNKDGSHSGKSDYGYDHNSSTPAPSLPPEPSNPTGTPSPRTISVTFSTLFLVLAVGVTGLLWWRKRQNTQGVNMFGRRLELGETPGAWSQIENGEGTGYGTAEKKGKAKEAPRDEAGVGYGTIQRGGVLHNTSASAGKRRPRKLPVITPLLSWVKARSRSKAHRAEEYGANSGTLPRARKARQRQSLSPASLPSSSNTSLRSGSFISSDENDVSIYMHVMQDDDSLPPSPSPRSLSMSMASQLSRISGSTDDLSEFEASPGRGRSRKRRDSQSSSSSEETSDTRSSFGFVRPVVATTGGATPSVFTATGHYITNNASTTTLASPPPRTSTPPETTSNQGSPYGPGLDFFSARAWRKPQTAGPSLMEVVNSWSAPPSPGDVEQGYRSMSGGSSRPS